MLKRNWGSLKAWPLAVTAYNHGRKSLMRACARVGSRSLEDMLLDYRTRSFGFASRNFFAELLAAIEVEKNAESYFGKVERAQEASFAEVKLSTPTSVSDFLKDQGRALKEVKDLNPALSEEVFSGKLPIPKGYPIRIPKTPSESAGKYGT